MTDHLRDEDPAPPDNSDDHRDATQPSGERHDPTYRQQYRGSYENPNNDGRSRDQGRRNFGWQQNDHFGNRGSHGSQRYYPRHNNYSRGNRDQYYRSTGRNRREQQHNNDRYYNDSDRREGREPATDDQRHIRNRGVHGPHIPHSRQDSHHTNFVNNCPTPLDDRARSRSPRGPSFEATGRRGNAKDGDNRQSTSHTNYQPPSVGQDDREIVTDTDAPQEAPKNPTENQSLVSGTTTADVSKHPSLCLNAEDLKATARLIPFPEIPDIVPACQEDAEIIQALKAHIHLINQSYIGHTDRLNEMIGDLHMQLEVENRKSAMAKLQRMVTEKNTQIRQYQNELKELKLDKSTYEEQEETWKQTYKKLEDKLYWSERELENLSRHLKRARNERDDLKQSNIFWMAEKNRLFDEKEALHVTLYRWKLGERYMADEELDEAIRRSISSAALDKELVEAERTTSGLTRLFNTLKQGPYSARDVLDLKSENRRLWHMVDIYHRKMEETTANADMEVNFSYGTVDELFKKCEDAESKITELDSKVQDSRTSNAKLKSDLEETKKKLSQAEERVHNLEDEEWSALP